MWIPAGGAEQVFRAEEWEALRDPDSTAVADMAVGLDVPPSREYATVCVAGRRADGTLTVEWYHTADGVRGVPEWVAPKVSAKVRAVVMDARNPVAELDWAAAGVRPTLAGTRDVAAAAGVLFDGIADGVLRHRGQVELSRGVLGAKRRPLMGGQAFTWERKAPGSSVLLAVSLALWAWTRPACSTRA